MNHDNYLPGPDGRPLLPGDVRYVSLPLVRHVMLYEISVYRHPDPFGPSEKHAILGHCKNRADAEKYAKCPENLYAIGASDFAITSVPALEVDGEYYLLAAAGPITVYA